MKWQHLLLRGSFRNLWSASLLSVVGSQATRMALILYLFHEEGDVRSLALLVMVETVPGFLAAPLAGAMIDRQGAKKFLIGADLGRAATLLLLLKLPEAQWIYLVAGINSVLTVVFRTARSSAVPLMVDAEDVPACNGLLSSASNLVMILGPVLGAELFLYAGLPTVLVLDAGTFLASAVLLAWISVRSPSPSSGDAVGGERTTTVSDLKAGWRYLRGHPVAFQLTGLFFVSMLCVGLWVPLAPFFIRDFLGAGDRILALQLAAFGVGGVAGGLTAPRLMKRCGKGKVVFGALLGEGAHMTIYSLVPHPSLSLLVCFGWGVIVSFIVVPFQSLLQLMVEESFLGRVFSFVRQSESLATVVAMGMAVLIADRWSSHAILLVAGVAYLVIVSASAATSSGQLLRSVR